MIDSVEEFVRLRASDDPAEHRRAATEGAPEHVWLAVIQERPDQRRWVAHNKTVPATVLSLLAADPDPEVRWTVASRRNAPTEVLRALATDSDETVRQRVARNRATPESVIRALAEDESATVRAAALPDGKR
ncbi:MAG: hypothetical protein QOC82_2693 [Frankiaceae bacterium]|jgi:hypothetical protein|nr:hypothetical protein [Frankiaceae bacterium]